MASPYREPARVTENFIPERSCVVERREYGKATMAYGTYAGIIALAIVGMSSPTFAPAFVVTAAGLALGVLVPAVIWGAIVVAES